MAKQYLDKEGLLYLWQKIKNLFTVKSDSIKNITRSGTTFTATRADGTTFTFDQQDNTVAKTTTTPKMDGTAAVGSETKYAAGDHVHPSDTSRVPTTRKVNGHPLSADVTVTKSDVGLGNVDNTADANKAVASAGKLTTAANIDGVDFDGAADIVRYGECSTAAATAAKVVTLEGNTPFKLVKGASVFVKFTITNTGAVGNLTLKVNDTEAKPIKRYGTSNLAGAGNLAAGKVVQFVYDGTNWLWVGDIDTNTTYTNMAQSEAAEGTVTTGRLISAKVLADTIKGYGGISGGYAPLDSNKLIPASYLPSYVDDVVEAYARSGQTALSSTWLSAASGGAALTPETGKIYVLMSDSGDYSANSQFRWSGTAYVKLADGGVSSITNAEIDTILAS